MTHEEIAAEKYPDKFDKWEMSRVKIQREAYIEGLKDSEKWVSVEDQEIESAANSYTLDSHGYDKSKMSMGFISGARWMRNKLPQPPKTEG